MPNPPPSPSPTPATAARPTGAASAPRAAPVALFYSYAHEDETLRDELAGHLKILERRGLISSWHDRQIVAGQAWDQAIDTHLATADLILLLVSADFIGSDYIFGVELARAMQRQARRECEVVPILVRPVDLDPSDAEDLPFLKLQALPPDLKPVTSWANRDEAWTQVAKGLRATVQSIQANRPSPPAPAPAPSPDGLRRSPGRAGVLAPELPDFDGPTTASVGVPPRARAHATEPAQAGDDPALDQLVGRFADQVNVAQQQRGGAPLFDHHLHALQQEARILIDLADPPRVLWVDDRPDNNLRERAVLAKLQIEVVCVTSTREALARLQADADAGEPFRLVISDWSRPVEGRNAGLQLIAAMQASGLPQPVLVYHGEFEATARARRAQRVADAGGFGEAVLPVELLALVQLALVG